jgi:hypothetical protein
VVVERTTTDRSTSEDTGLVSGTLNVIGEVIALPFRAVGGLLRGCSKSLGIRGGADGLNLSYDAAKTGR